MTATILSTGAGCSLRDGSSTSRAMHAIAQIRYVCLRRGGPICSLGPTPSHPAPCVHTRLTCSPGMKHCCVEQVSFALTGMQDLVVPSFKAVNHYRHSSLAGAPPKQRDIFFFFRGDVGKGRFPNYSRGVRQKVRLERMGTGAAQRDHCIA